jgi:universal stress protein A
MEILVATDFSESAVTALRAAVRYARPFGARIHLLHVFAPGEVEVTKLLADAAAQAGSDVPVTVAATGGDPAHEVLRYATRHRIDLIVVGTHGRTGVSRVLLGSVAERVTRGAACPVLVVPPVAEASSRPADVIAGEEAPAAARLCLVCAKPTIDLICEPCRTRIRGEALEHKQREERGGRR